MDHAARSTSPAVWSTAALLVAFFPDAGAASHSCPTPQPAFAYVDVDNDGCYTSGVDSGSVDAQLQAPLVMAEVPSFVGPAGTGLVVPHTLTIPEEANPYWSVENDVWIDGQIDGDSSLRIEAGGTTNLHGRIRMKSRGFSDESDVRLGCATGCGAVVVADEAQLGTTGQLRVYDAAIGNDVRINVKCEPGGVPSCGGSAWFLRATSFGDRVRLNSPGGIRFEEGDSLLVIGDDAKLKTKAVATDGGTLGFATTFELGAGVSFGSRASVRSGGSLSVTGAEDAMPTTGPVSFGEAARLTSGSTLLVRGTVVSFGATADLRGKRDVSNPGQLSSVILDATGGPLIVGSESSIAGGEAHLGATGVLDVGANVGVSASGDDQAIELEGLQIEVGPFATIRKSTSDSTPIVIEGVSSVSIASSELQGAGLNVSVSDLGSTIAFNTNEAAGSSGTAAVFSAPGGGTCDLTGSEFRNLALDTSACGTVVGP